MMTTETTDFMTQMFKQAAETFNETMQTGLKFQEQTARFWTGTFGKNTEQFRTQFEKVANEAIPTTKKNLEQFHRMFDDQAQKSLDMLRQTFETAQGLTDKGLHEQTMSLWRTSFDAMRSSVDMVSKANADMFEKWSSIARKACAGSKTNGKTTR